MTAATDELRRMLDERGVPYETNDDMGASETRWNGFTAYQLTPNAKLLMHPTPEQAIAATLGSELNPDGLPVGLTISEDGELLNWRGENYVKQSTLGSGTLTAEQVRKAAKSNSRKYKSPVDDGIWMKEYDWQAIADELNSRAERTCKQEERGWGTEGDHARVWLTCGHDCMVPTVQDLPNYCPSCGAKVVDE